MLTLAEVYTRFKVDRRTVYKWIRAGMLIGYKLPGAGWRFERADVEAFQRNHLDRSA